MLKPLPPSMNPRFRHAGQIAVEALAALEFFDPALSSESQFVPVLAVGYKGGHSQRRIDVCL